MDTLRAVLGSAWAYAAALLFAAILLVWHFAAYRRALRPARGTLEWIGQVDRPPFSLWRAEEPGRGDVLPVLLCCVIALCFRGFGAGMASRKAIAMGLLPPVALGRLILLYAVSPMLSAAACYFLIRRFSGGCLVPLMASALLSVNPADACALPFLTLSCLFAARYFSRRAEGESGWTELAVSAAVLAVGVYFRPAALYFGIVLYLLLAAGALARWHFTAEPARGRRLAEALWLWPVCLGAALLLAQLPGAAAAGTFGPGFLSWLRSRAAAAFAGTLSVPAGLALSPSELTVAVYALPAAAFCLADAVRTRDFRDFAAFWLLLGGAAAALFTACDALVLFCLPACARVWARWLGRKGLLPVCAASGVLLAVSVLVCVLAWTYYL